ncbi:MAG: hypothetical protein WCR67_05355 [Bacilli bacterium]
MSNDGGPKAVDSKLASVSSYLTSFNYTWKQEPQTLNGKSFDTGNYCYNPNYFYADYSDAYLKAIKGSYSEDIIFRSGFIKIGANDSGIAQGVYSFTPKVDEQGNEYIDTSCLKPAANVSLKWSFYTFSEASLDFFDELSSTEFICKDSTMFGEIAESFFGNPEEITTYSLDSVYLSVGSDSLGKINNFKFGLSSGTQVIEQTNGFTNLGMTKVQFLEDFLASLD